MKILSISGGETKLSGLVGIARSVVVEKGYKPDIITGNSASALAVVLVAMGLWETLKVASVDLTLDSIFSVKPINKKRKLTFKAILRVVSSKESISVMDNLETTIKKYISEGTFNRYIAGNYPATYVNTTDFKTGARIVYNLKNVSYHKFIKIVKASSSVPMLGEAVHLDNGYHLDGGIRTTILSAWAIDKFKDEVKTHVSIYSRPDDLTNILDEWKPSNVVATAGRTAKIALLTISKKDELVEDLMCDKYQVEQHKLYLPKLSNQAFNVDKKHLLDLYESGIKVGRRIKL
mgnify:CR=1 FL=1